MPIVSFGAGSLRFQTDRKNHKRRSEFPECSTLLDPQVTLDFSNYLVLTGHAGPPCSDSIVLGVVLQLAQQELFHERSNIDAKPTAQALLQSVPITNRVRC